MLWFCLPHLMVWMRAVNVNVLCGRHVSFHSLNWWIIYLTILLFLEISLYHWEIYIFHTFGNITLLFFMIIFPIVITILRYSLLLCKTHTIAIPILFHTMAYFYVAYRYVISEWRSIRPVKINQYNITMATHCEITMGNDVARDSHCDVTMSNDITMCTYQGITMHNDVVTNIFHYVFSALCLIVLFYYG